MEPIYVTLLAFSALSLALNLYLYLRLRRVKKTKSLSFESRELFRHLSTYGNGVLQIKVLDPSEIFVRAPTR